MISSFIEFLRSYPGLWIIWGANTTTLCLLCYSIGREMAWRKWKKFLKSKGYQVDEEKLK